MPQFDKITFFNQVFWLFFFFGGFYLIFLKIFLPKLASILKVRTKKLEKGASTLTAFTEEQNNATGIFHTLIENITLIVKNVIVVSTEDLTNGISASLKDLNENNFKKSNSLIEKTLHKQVARNFSLANF